MGPDITDQEHRNKREGNGASHHLVHTGTSGGGGAMARRTTWFTQEQAGGQWRVAPPGSHRNKREGNGAWHHLVHTGTSGRAMARRTTWFTPEQAGGGGCGGAMARRTTWFTPEQAGGWRVGWGNGASHHLVHTGVVLVGASQVALLRGLPHSPSVVEETSV